MPAGLWNAGDLRDRLDCRLRCLGPSGLSTSSAVPKGGVDQSGLMTEAKSKPKRGRPPNLELRERIRKLYKGGMSQAEISRKLGMKEAAVRYHIREIGIAPRSPESVFEANKPKGDLKVCVICGEEKELSQFRNPKHAACRACRYQEGPDKA